MLKEIQLIVWLLLKIKNRIRYELIITSLKQQYTYTIPNLELNFFFCEPQCRGWNASQTLLGAKYAK